MTNGGMIQQVPGTVPDGYTRVNGYAREDGQPDQATQPAPTAPGQPTATPSNVQASQANVKHDFAAYVSRATTLIHAPETTGAIQGMLAGPDPVSKVAAATVMVMQRLDAAARTAGIEVQDAIKVFGAVEVVNMVAELGEAAGKMPVLNQHLKELALSVAVQDYVKGEVKAGRIDPQRLQVAMQADIRQLPPKQRKEIQDAQIRIQQTARAYNGGAGMGQQFAAPAGTTPVDAAQG